MKQRSQFDAVAEEVTAAPSWKVIQRFWSRINKNGPKQPHMKTCCWIWTAGTANGYGVIWCNGQTRRATHLAFFLSHGRWPNPCALHRCDVPACVRHIFEGTRQENMVDMIRKGRDRKAVGERASRTKLTTAQVKAIRQERGSSRAVGKKFGVSHTAVVLIRNGSTWSHV